MMSNEKRWEKSRRMRQQQERKFPDTGRDDDSYHEGAAVIVEKGMENHLME